METLIKGGTIINEGNSFEGYLVVKDDRLDIIHEGNDYPQRNYDEVIDASGCFIFPGIIDCHVHFREPGLTEKADIESESRAAAFGGVTSYCEMPNTVPQTTTLEALDEKFQLASQKSHVNYSFFFGATNDNYTLFADLDRHRIPGIKIFMGSSTGNMLVDRYGALLKIFETAARLNLPLMAHCEDTEIINRNMEQMKKAYGDDPDVMLHPLIRSEEACYESSALAAQLARTYGTHLHIAHVSTARELELGGGNVTLEAVLAHLLFTSADYSRKRALIKCNPAVKRADDRDALRLALADGRISTIATDHAPHLLSQKQGGCAKAASGMPMVQFSLPAMLGLVDEGVVSFERVIDLMCHQPAQLFSIRERGFLRPGYKADIAIVRPVEPYGVTPALIQSKCGWSPLDGDLLHWRVTHTICNGRIILNDGTFDTSSQGEELRFR